MPHCTVCFKVWRFLCTYKVYFEEKVFLQTSQVFFWFFSFSLGLTGGGMECILISLSSFKTPHLKTIFDGSSERWFFFVFCLIGIICKCFITKPTLKPRMFTMLGYIMYGQRILGVIGLFTNLAFKHDFRQISLTLSITNKQARFRTAWRCYRCHVSRNIFKRLYTDIDCLRRRFRRMAKIFL